MPIATLETPDGKFLDVEYPDGTSDEEIMRFASAEYAKNPSLAYERKREAETAPEAGQGNLLTGIGNVGKEIGAGYVSTLAGMAKGDIGFADTLGLVDAEKGGAGTAVDWLSNVQDKAHEWTDPEKPWYDPLAQGLGSVAGFATGVLVSPGSKARGALRAGSWLKGLLLGGKFKKEALTRLGTELKLGRDATTGELAAEAPRLLAPKWSGTPEEPAVV